MQALLLSLLLAGNSYGGMSYDLAPPLSSGGGTLGGNLLVCATCSYGWVGRGTISASADGVFVLLDTAGTAFTRLDFGGTSSSYPSLVRNGTTLQAKVADNSAFSPFQGSYFVTASNGNLLDSIGIEIAPSAVINAAPTTAGTSPDSSIYRSAAGKWSTGSGTQTSTGVWDDVCYTQTGINMNTAAAQTVFTVPTAKIWHWRSVELFDCNATVNTATWTVGCNGAGTDGGFGTMSSVTFNLSATQSHRWFESASSAEGAAAGTCQLDIATQEGAGDLCSVRFCGSLEN